MAFIRLTSDDGKPVGVRTSSIDVVSPRDSLPGSIVVKSGEQNGIAVAETVDQILALIAAAEQEPGR